MAKFLVTARAASMAEAPCARILLLGIGRKNRMWYDFVLTSSTGLRRAVQVWNVLRQSNPATRHLYASTLGFSTAAAGARGTSFGLAETCRLPPTRCFRTSPRRFSEQASHRLRPNGD